MNRCLPAFAFALLAAPAAAPSLRSDEPPPAFDVAQLRPGLSQDAVVRLLGQPKRVARQILYRRYLEQWVYDGPKAVRVEFDCPRGQAPQVLSVFPLAVAKP